MLQVAACHINHGKWSIYPELHQLLLCLVFIQEWLLKSQLLSESLACNVVEIHSI